jgi:RNA polymerase sigma factor (sigma-70 family)
MDLTRVSLIEGLKAGSRDAWERFALLYQTTIRSIVFSSCRSMGLPDAKSGELADEVTQELMLAIRKKVQSFDLAKRSPGGFRAWLKRTTVHLLVTYLRRNARHWGQGGSDMVRRLAEEPARVVLESEIDRELERQILEEAMQELRAESPEECAIVDRLGWGDGRCKAPTGLNAMEVARRHGRTASAVLKIKSRLLTALKDKVDRKRELID